MASQRRPAAQGRNAVALAVAGLLLASIARPAEQEAGAIRLIVRGDDFGFTHASNEAMLRAFAAGFMT